MNHEQGDAAPPSQLTSERELYPAPKYRVKPLIETIITLHPTSPDYPLEKPFEDYYKELGETQDDFELKYSIATGLIQDGRYKRLSLLIRGFSSAGTKKTDEITRLKEGLQLQVREALLKRGNNKERRAAEEQLVEFAQDISQGRTPQGEEFRKLVDLFGSSRAVDIFYRSRPDFRGIPVERVKGVLAEYLGNFLNVRRAFNIDDLEVGRQYLSDPSFQEALLEVMKDSCLVDCRNVKKNGSQLKEQQIIDNYITGIESNINQYQDISLDSVTTQLRKYYLELFALKKPYRFVRRLRKGRAFPDLGQLINVKEISDKKRMVIADEMGSGKSVSPILAKESLGIGLTIITAPGNVIDDPATWQAYLSDLRGAEGRQIGYYKFGEAPRVLVIDKHSDLKNCDPTKYDYLLISHEKLTDRYTSILLDMNYEMLVIDEAHKLKNLSGVRSVNVLKLASKLDKEEGYLTVLTGTPADNKVEDIAMILKLLEPSKYEAIPNKKFIRMIINGDYIDLRKALIPRMQMKSLNESINMPPLKEIVKRVEMSELEKEVYEVLMEEDEIEASEKIRILRQFCLNPDLLKVTANIESQKLKLLEKDLQEMFKEKGKALIFVNDYIEGVIRGDQSIISKLSLPSGVEISVVDGSVSKSDRSNIQRDLKRSDKQMALFVSGQTADVGVDYSGADEVFFYNLPWTKYKQKQELHRVYREGLRHPLNSTTYVTAKSIEEGIEVYIEAKYRAVEKLLRGIPITELEKELIEKSEFQDDSLEVSPELAEYYFSSWDRMRHIFAHVKEIGEHEFRKFLASYGDDYAQCYEDLGMRSYQANANRVAGTVIDLMVRKSKQATEDLRILDLASGPEMLRRHIPDDYGESVYSLDINRNHFPVEDDKRRVGSMLNLPYSDEFFDYTNLSLGWHYTNFIPRHDKLERLVALREIHRTLKTGGRALLNLIYSLDIKNFDMFQEVADNIGFKVLGDFSGEVTHGQSYHSRIVALEKKDDLGWTLDETLELIGRENFDGLKFKKTGLRLKDSRNIVKEFDLQGENVPIRFNDLDYKVLLEEEQIRTRGQELKVQYGSIDKIPREVIVENNFIRILIGKRYNLFKQMQENRGAVVVK